MHCEDLRARVKAYVAGSLPAADIGALDDHLDRCDACAALVNECLAMPESTTPIGEHEELVRLARLPVVSGAQAQAGVDAVLSEVQRLRAPVAAPASPSEGATGSWRAWLRGFDWPRLSYGSAAALVAVGVLALVAWNGHVGLKRGEQKRLASESRERGLERENAGLRKDLARATSSPIPAPPNASQRDLEQKVASLRTENDRLKSRLADRSTASPSSPGNVAALHDAKKVVAVGKNGAVRIISESSLPAPLSQSVRSLVLEGSAPPTKPVVMAMARLRADATRSALRSAAQAEKPLPISIGPVLTAVRSLQPTLRWRAIPGAQRYEIRVAYPEEKENGKVVWEGSAGPQVEITLPAGTLQRGQTYFWQVEAVVDGDPRLSPAVGFWVVDAKTLREIEAGQRAHPDSPLVLAALYERHGLYTEARAQLERLAAANPDSPYVRKMLEQMDRRTGAAAPEAR